MWLIDLLGNIVAQFVIETLLPRITAIFFGRNYQPQKGTVTWYVVRMVAVLVAFVITALMGILLAVLLIKVARMLQN